MDPHPPSPSDQITPSSRPTSGPSSISHSPTNTTQPKAPSHKSHRPNHHSTKTKPPTSTAKPTWLSTTTRKLTTWLSTTEPSAPALRQHRKQTFQRAGLSHDEAEPHSKLHAPVGEIPREAIRPGGRGLSPEEVLVREREERRKRRRRMNREGTGGGVGWGGAAAREIGGVGGGAGEEGKEGGKEPDWSSLGSFSVYSGQESMKGSMGGLPYTGSSDKFG